MKLHYLVEIVLLGIMSFCSASSWGQTRRVLTREQMDSILHPKVLARANQLIRFSEEVINLGTMTEDDKPVDVIFSFQNIGKEPLVIRRITTDCGCTKATTDKTSYLVGEQGTLKVRYTPKNRVGTIDASTWIYSSVSAAQPIAKLTLIGEVFPGKDEWKGYRYSMGTLRLKRKELHFDLTKDKVQTERILCANSGTVPLRLKVKNLPAFMQFSTEPEIIAPGSEADIVIKADLSQVPSGNKLAKVYILELEGLNNLTSVNSTDESSNRLTITVDLPEE